MVIIRRVRAAEHAVPWLVMAYVVSALVAPVRRSDLAVFLRAGHDVLHGVNPYTGLHDPLLYAGSAFVYPWWTAVAFGPLSLLPTDLADACWTVASIAAVLLACRLAGLVGLLAPLVVLTAATTIRGLQVGSLNAFLLLGCVVAWRYRDRARVAGTALALVIGAKLFLLPLLVWPLLSRRPAVLRAALLGLLGLLGVSFLLGPIGPLDYLHMLGRLGAHESAQGFSLHRLVNHVTSSGVASAVCLLVGVLLLGWGAWVRRRHGSDGDLMLFTCCLVAALVLTPIVWSHYFLLLMAPLLLRRAPVPWLLAASAVSWVAAAPVLTRVLVPGHAMGHLAVVYVSALLMLTALHPWRQTVSPSR